MNDDKLPPGTVALPIVKEMTDKERKNYELAFSTIGRFGQWCGYAMTMFQLGYAFGMARVATSATFMQEADKAANVKAATDFLERIAKEARGKANGLGK